MHFASCRERLFSTNEEQSTTYSNDNETREYDEVNADSYDDLMVVEETLVGQEEYYDAPEIAETNLHRRRATIS